MRLLLVLYHPGHLRLFESTIRELAARGHAVEITFDRSTKGSRYLGVLDTIEGSVSVLGETPLRTDGYARFADRLRRVTDYVRFLHPAFSDAEPLRLRREKYLPPRFRFAARLPTIGRASARALIRVLLALEGAVPSSGELERFIADRGPDLVAVSPLVTHHSARQTDVLKSARALGVPTVLCVGSWDHLTTKGLIRQQPDRVLVWNDAQREEASELHLMPAERVRTTGAQPFDIWFERTASVGREEFCRRVGLPPDRPFVLYVGSSSSIAPHKREVAFVRRWVAALRSSDRLATREIGVLVRPHPGNTGSWPEADLDDLAPAAVWPLRPANELDEGDRAEYFDSIHHSAAVVGVNTSAMIESAILKRPVLTVQAEEFESTQGGTVHFRHLLPENGGFVLSSDDLEEHLASLSEVLERPEERAAVIDRFLRTFVRPHGIDRAATPAVVDELEAAARIAPAPPGHSVLSRLLPLALAAGGRMRVLTGRRKGKGARLRLRAARTARHGRRRVRRRVRRAGRRLAPSQRAKIGAAWSKEATPSPRRRSAK